MKRKTENRITEHGKRSGHVLLSAAFWAILVLMAVLNAVNTTVYADFTPWDGDFQNYNPIRRLYSGQIPYVDFQAYLGMGQLALGSMLTAVLGGTLHASMYAMKIITFLVFSVSIYVIAYCVIGKKRIAEAIVLIIAALDLANFSNINALLGQTLTGTLGITRGPGASMRFIRCAVIVILPALSVVLFRLIERLHQKWDRLKSKDIKVIGFAAPGIVSGLAVVWSNDGGICAAITVLLFSCLAGISVHKKSFKKWFVSMVVMGCGFLLSLALTLLIVTRGRPWAFFSRTLDISSYQWWYCVHNPGTAVYYLWDIILDQPYAFACVGLIAAYAVFLFRGGVTLPKWRRYGVPLCTLFGSYFSVCVYRVSNGGSLEFFTVILFFVCLIELIALLYRLCARAESQLIDRRVVIAALCVGFAITATQAKTSFSLYLRSKTDPATYVEELGGRMPALGDTILDTKAKLGDAKVFSTWASAVEAVTDQFQPSGTDYIVHILGDKSREDYLNAYHNADADYVAVLRDDYSKWERFNCGSTWFFYREFLNDQAISFANKYQYYYVRSDTENKVDVPCSIKISQVEGNIAVIDVQCESDSYNGLMDLKLDYEIEKTDNRRNWFCFKTMLHVQDVLNADDSYHKDFCLPGDGNSAYIPVIIKNGVGRITLTAYPNGYTTLSSVSAVSEGMFLNALDIATVGSVRQEEHTVLQLMGVSEETLASAYRLQHENETADVLEWYSDKSGMYCVVDAGKSFIDSLDGMSAVKVLTRIE